jgi:hypothetical protein
VAGNAPIPYKKSELTPFLGDAPDTSDDIRGGIELEGIVHINKFVHDGGLLVLSPGAAAIAPTYGLIEGVTVQEPRTLNARGAVLNAQIADARSPIAYGYETNLAVYFNQSPILQANAGGFGGFGGGGGGGRGGAPGGGGGGGIQGVPAGRPTGRGTETDQDIPQGRPVDMGPPASAVPAGGGGRGGRGGRGGAVAAPADENPLANVPEEFRAQLAASMPAADQMPRTVVRFVANEKDLLYSGLLTGGAELAGHPAVVDAPAGKGHIVLFSNNPMWRNQTQGSYFLLFNAMLNWDHLGAGRRAPARPGANASADEILQWLDWDSWQQQ